MNGMVGPGPLDPRWGVRSPGHIYFIQAGGKRGPVKIGHTNSGTRSRLQVMQSGHYAKLRLVHQEDGSKWRERELHARYAEHRIRGEWFKAIVLELHLGVLA